MADKSLHGNDEGFRGGSPVAEVGSEERFVVVFYVFLLTNNGDS